MSLVGIFCNKHFRYLILLASRLIAHPENTLKSETSKGWQDIDI